MDNGLDCENSYHDAHLDHESNSGTGVTMYGRRNPWGNHSYADLITQAISSSPDKKLTLSQIYDWMVANIPYFSERQSNSKSAGWKVGFLFFYFHNFTRFCLRIQFATTCRCTKSLSRSPMKERASHPGGRSILMVVSQGSQGGGQPQVISRCCQARERGSEPGQSQPNIQTGRIMEMFQ